MPPVIYLSLAAAFIIGAIVVTVVQSRRQRLRRPEASFTSQASDVVSLDEDSDDRGDDEGPATKVPQMALVGAALVTILLGIYIQPEELDYNLKVTYEELGVIKLTEYVANQFEGQGATTVLLVPPNMFRDTAHPWMRLGREGLSGKVELLDVESVQLRSLRGINPGALLNAGKVKEMQAIHSKLNVIVSLADLAPDLDLANWPPRQKRPYIAVLASQSELYRYLGAIEQGYVDLVVIPRGFFGYNTMIPQSVEPGLTFDQQYILLTSNNAKHYRDTYRQLLVPYPILPETFPK